MLKTYFHVVRIVSASLAILSTSVVLGQNYPSKPIRIVTSSLGGGSDFTARLVAQGISGPLGQPVIVDNRSSGVVPAQVVSKAPPDGYTLFVASSSSWIGPLLYKVPYDLIRDFSPVTQVEGSPSVLVVHPTVSVKSVRDLIALAKTRPGELNYGATGVGANDHLAAELFNSMAGINIVRVRFAGTAASMTSLVAGEIQLRFASGPSAMPQVKADRLRALATTGAQPSALFPGLPTVAASGLPGYEAIGMTAIFVPSKTPDAIIKRLNEEIVRALTTQESRAKFFNIGMDTENIRHTPDELAAIVKADIAKWAKVIKNAGIKVE